MSDTVSGRAGVTFRHVLVWFAVAAMALLIVGLALSRAPAMHGDDDAYVVGPNETRVETLMVAASALEIDGTVDGDVVAWARHVRVKGRIRGNLVAFAADVEIEVEGIVEGAVQCVCRHLAVRGHVGGNAYALARSAVVTATGRVDRDVVAIAALARIEGDVGRDLRLHVEDAMLAGRVGRDVRGDVTRLGASAPLRVGGDMELAVSEPEAVHIDADARVAGVTRIDEVPPKSKYTHPGWYAAQVVQLIAAFIVGLVLVRVYPPLFTMPFGKPPSTAAYLGLGLLVLVATPILAGLAVLTIVGLPLGLIGLGAYVLALYLAGIVVGGRLGNAVLRRRRPNTALPLLVGLLILGIATALPFAGPVIALVVIIVGLAIMLRVVKERRAV